MALQSQSQMQSLPDASTSIHANDRLAYLGQASSSSSTRTRTRIILTSPTNEDKNSDKDGLFAKEMNNLSVQEREHVFEEVHGVLDMVQENSEFIEHSLAGMQTELEKIKTKSAYEKAQTLSPLYVQDHKLRLMFLRAERFQVEPAACRFAEFFEQKLELFGPEKLAKDISLEDFDADDLEYIQSGRIQLLPTRDRAGRAVLCFLSNYMQCVKVENLVRYSFPVLPKTQLFLSYIDSHTLTRLLFFSTVTNVLLYYHGGPRR
jgi:hypothetical protein